MFDKASRTVRVRTTCGCIDSAGGEMSLSSLSDEWLDLRGPTSKGARGGKGEG